MQPGSSSRDSSLNFGFGEVAAGTLTCSSAGDEVGAAKVEARKARTVSVRRILVDLGRVFAGVLLSLVSWAWYWKLIC